MLNREPMGMKPQRRVGCCHWQIVSVLNREPMGMKPHVGRVGFLMGATVSVLNREPMGMKHTRHLQSQFLA